MKSLKAKLPPDFRFDREEANERTEPGQQSTQASAEASAEPGGGLAMALRIHQRFKGMGIDKLPIPERTISRPLPDFGQDSPRGKDYQAIISVTPRN